MAMKTGNYNVIQSAELDEYELEKEWQDINWHYVEHSIFKLQRQIFRAEKEGNYRKVQKLSRLLVTINSFPFFLQVKSMLERACRETDTSRSEERKGEQSPRLIRPYYY